MEKMRYLVTLLALLVLPLSMHAKEMNACDREVGHPSDPNRVGPGRSTAEVVTHVAIPACRAAIEKEPDNPRFHYQLGRALYYWAGANDGDTTEAIKHIKIAAEMDYTQAVFVYGYLNQLMGNHCESEPLIRKAAEMNLKSGMLTYVNTFQSGGYDGCDTASVATMRGYLENVAKQMDGYYEGLLLKSLQRQLPAD